MSFWVGPAYAERKAARDVEEAVRSSKLDVMTAQTAARRARAACDVAHTKYDDAVRQSGVSAESRHALLLEYARHNQALALAEQELAQCHDRHAEFTKLQLSVRNMQRGANDAAVINRAAEALEIAAQRAGAQDADKALFMLAQKRERAEAATGVPSRSSSSVNAVSAAQRDLLARAEALRRGETYVSGAATAPSPLLVGVSVSPGGPGVPPPPSPLPPPPSVPRAVPPMSRVDHSAAPVTALGGLIGAIQALPGPPSARTPASASGLGGARSEAA